MTYDEFVKKYMGKSIDYDKAAGVQCVDIAQLYVDKVFGCPGIIYANGKDYYEKFENYKVLTNNFIKIKNTPTLIPKKGDIVVWGTGLGNKWGHVAISTGEGNTNEFYSIDENWGQKLVHKVKHNYKGFLGVLRPKDQSKINSTKPKEQKYTKGTYKVTANLLHVRDKANGKIKTYKELTKNAQAQNKKLGNEKANGLLKGCVCEVTETKNNWGKIPSGWICLDYCKKI